MVKRFANLPFKTQKNILLILLFLTVLVLYRFVISPTISEFKRYSDLKYKAEKSLKASDEVLKLKAQLNNVSGNSMNNKNSVHNQILEKVIRICDAHGASLKSYPDSTLSANGSVSIETNEVILQGSFKQLLQAIYSLEHQVPVIPVSAAYYRVEMDNDTRKKNLNVAIYFQTIKQ